MAGVTVLAALTAVTRPEATGYMMNMSKFAARNPELPAPCGTTRNRAFHHPCAPRVRAAEGPPALVTYSFAPVCIRQVRN